MTSTEVAQPPAPPERPRRRLTRPVIGIGVLAVVMLLFGLFGSSYQGRLGEVQKNDNAAYLPSTAESTEVSEEEEAFSDVGVLPGFIVYQRDGGLTAADRAAIDADATALRELRGVAGDQVTPPQLSSDGTTASLAVPLIGREGGTEVDGDDLVAVQERVLDIARAGAPDGLAVHSAGAGGLLVAFFDVFEEIDGVLLLAAGVVVIAILLVVYRSPVLWFVPLFSALLALGSASLIVYQLAKNDVLTLNGQSQGILFVLVLGAGTDYALLLISRYREELHRHESRLQAMTRAWRGAAPPIIASGATVSIGLLCLLFGELNSDKSLGPVCAIGIACTVLVMLTFLPAFLVLFGRWVFWPRVPHVDQASDLATHGVWGRFAPRLSRRARPAWIGSVVVLLVCAAFLPTLRTQGLSVVDSFTDEPDAVVGQKIFDEHFAQGTGAPAEITTNADAVPDVVAAVADVPGVASGPGAVCVAPDYARLAGTAAGGGAITPGADGCLPPEFQVRPADGRLLVNAQLADRYDTTAAIDTVQRIRDAVHAVPGADARVGGQTAITLDTLDASRHDRNLIIPIILAVILVVLAVLLRAIVLPVLLVATVVLSFCASLGVSALVFTHVFGFADSDPGFPLFAFVFLVALGIDYNIFLMTRVREETLLHGTREGIVRGLAVTGGVITSAGLVLAATFAVLGVLPLVFLAEIGFAVAFGVLLDTFLVRSVLVPALCTDIGRRIWWPSRLARGAD
ncbi:MMPL family transporter [Modestobacter sp. NPDC049651]|uniref:MMPL family transporter n=1 Tax=unclassified Modestobacter TaxID=2643866 RepID=UPI0033FF7968